MSGLVREADESWRAWALPGPHAGDPAAAPIEGRGLGALAPSGSGTVADYLAAWHERERQRPAGCSAAPRTGGS